MNWKILPWKKLPMLKTEFQESLNFLDTRIRNIPNTNPTMSQSLLRYICIFIHFSNRLQTCIQALEGRDAAPVGAWEGGIMNGTATTRNTCNTPGKGQPCPPDTHPAGHSLVFILLMILTQLQGGACPCPCPQNQVSLGFINQTTEVPSSAEAKSFYNSLGYSCIRAWQIFRLGFLHFTCQSRLSILVKIRRN